MNSKKKYLKYKKKYINLKKLIGGRINCLKDDQGNDLDTWEKRNNYCRGKGYLRCSKKSKICTNVPKQISDQRKSEEKVSDGEAKGESKEEGDMKLTASFEGHLTEADENYIVFDKSKIKPLYIKELCCNGDPTQYPDHMCNESLKHSAAAIAASVVNSTANTLSTIGALFTDHANQIRNLVPPSSLDSIIVISNKDHSSFNRKSGKINNKINYISDHNMIYTEYEDYNIISFNLEGLCITNLEDSIQVLRFLKEESIESIDNIYNIIKRLELFLLHFERELFTKPFILCLQEIVLKTNIEAYEINIEILQILFLNNGYDFNFIPDKATGGIVYSNRFKIEKGILIHREGDKVKKCLAINFKDKTNNEELLVVNIHLKAGGVRIKQSDLDIIHIKELSNIVNSIESINPDFEKKTFFCGDFNNENKIENLKIILNSKYNLL